jgi:glycine dehydrogenase subunit 1
VDYIPNTNSDRERMLSAVGAKSAKALFADVPKEVLLKEGIPLPNPLSELELSRELSSLAEKNLDSGCAISFLGGGVYNHFVPAVVRHLLGRSEFYTSYTPYQPELSQGMLQAIYEYQTLICSLTKMDVANASMYDGASAAAEAVSLACHYTKRKKVVLSGALHPEYMSVIKTYGRFADWDIVEASHSKEGTLNAGEVTASLGGEPACFVLSQPNFFGCVEDEAKKIAEAVRSKGGLLIVSVDPISLGMLKPPGEYGADIVTGEGSCLGSPPSLGGPGLGVFAAKEALVRFIPGRLSGATVDAGGRRGFVLTLQTREQHIRRERATSNICSNEALNALAAAMYLSALGKRGLRAVSELCVQNSNYAKEKISKIPGFSMSFPARTFKEFVVSTPAAAEDVNKRLLKKGIIGGLPLSRFYPKLKNQMLLCFTEATRKKEIDLLLKSLKEIK